MTIRETNGALNLTGIFATAAILAFGCGVERLSNKSTASTSRSTEDSEAAEDTLGIRGGVAAQDNRYEAVVRIVAKKPKCDEDDNFQEMIVAKCTGTIISSYNGPFVLTASHCLRSNCTRQGTALADISMVGRFPGVPTVEQVYAAPLSGSAIPRTLANGIKTVLTGKDYAVIKYRIGKGMRPGQEPQMGPRIGLKLFRDPQGNLIKGKTTLQIAGFGSRGLELGGENSQVMKPAVDIGLAVGQVQFQDALLGPFQSLNFITVPTLLDKQIACQGDSGGPLLDDDFRVLGVLSKAFFENEANSNDIKNGAEKCDRTVSNTYSAVDSREIYSRFDFLRHTGQTSTLAASTSQVDLFDAASVYPVALTPALGSPSYVWTPVKNGEGDAKGNNNVSFIKRTRALGNSVATATWTVAATVGTPYIVEASYFPATQNATCAMYKWSSGNISSTSVWTTLGRVNQTPANLSVFSGLNSTVWNAVGGWGNKVMVKPSGALNPGALTNIHIRLIDDPSCKGTVESPIYLQADSIRLTK